MTTTDSRHAGYDNLTAADLDRLTRRLAAPGTAVCTQAGDCARRDALVLAGEVRRLRLALALVRTAHANLTAAACATLAGHGDGEPDPLAYLRDELDHPEHRDGPEDLDALDPDAPIGYRLTDTAHAATRTRGWTA